MDDPNERRLNPRFTDTEFNNQTQTSVEEMNHTNIFKLYETLKESFNMPSEDNIYLGVKILVILLGIFIVKTQFFKEPSKKGANTKRTSKKQSINKHSNKKWEDKKTIVI